MNLCPKDSGIVLLCDQHGAIVRLLRDDLHLAARVPIGAPLSALADSSVREKAEHFLTDLQTKQAVYDWEITVPVDGILVPLHFAGARIDEGFLVVVACSRDGLAHMNEELMLINNEQTNALRTALKDLSLQSRQQPDRDRHLYNDLSELNNELANLQREMVKKNVELEKLNEQKNRFLGMAAHDLRSPLGIILSYSEFLEAEAGSVLNEEQREFVTTIKETSEFMLRLVEDLLDVTTIEAGKLNLDRRSTDLGRLIAHNVALNRVLSAKKEIRIEFAPPAAATPFPFDAGKIEQVLNNLIGNAMKFSHRGTAICVRLTVDEKAATVAVEDHGQGIPAAEMPKLFKPFSKASVRGTAGEQSTGLGLAICRKIVEGHGGRLWVESTVGEGATFFFTLPTAP